MAVLTTMSILLLCCLLCFVYVDSFLYASVPWTVIIFDDIENDASGNYYTPFMENRPLGPVNNRRRRPPPPVGNLRPPIPMGNLRPLQRMAPNNMNIPRREAVTPVNTVKYISPYPSTPYCPVGQQYVYLPPTLDGDAVASICPLNNPVHPLCRCQTGCRHKNFFIPYGTSIMVDKCGNKCYCNSLNGEVECEFDSC
ncbi:uncharacterized protein LOC133178340 [Saccostrea echinata]|uniref:uncharacterized protein LOC133178340 n=1 Tax=Saccostrea echinata TaxID=191078 RepID=UPI002A80D329|nr:uncharacterized protein LOC133178340 [Saccostrea echinata]